MGSLYYTIEEDLESGLRAVLSGVLDEASDLSGLLERIDRDVVLDLRGIERINSMGVRRWIRAMATLTGRQRVTIEACSGPIVFQANMVQNFFGGAEIRSSMAPYFCPQCGQELNLIVTVQEVREAQGEAPEKSCPSCGGPTEFDELDQFLQFMRPEDGA